MAPKSAYPLMLNYNPVFTDTQDKEQGLRKYDLRIGRLNFVRAQSMNAFRSVLEMPPMGFLNQGLVISFGLVL